MHVPLNASRMMQQKYDIFDETPCIVCKAISRLSPRVYRLQKRPAWNPKLQHHGSNKAEERTGPAALSGVKHSSREQLLAVVSSKSRRDGPLKASIHDPLNCSASTARLYTGNTGARPGDRCDCNRVTVRSPARIPVRRS